MEIPHGYSKAQHEKLKETISEGSFKGEQEPLKIMACHESFNEHPDMGIGWAHHQLNRGNNFALRIRFFSCENSNQMQVTGEQHERFEDTLP